MIVFAPGKGKAVYRKYRALPFFYTSLLIFLILPVFFPPRASAQSTLPQIPRLDSRDMIFRQYMADVEAARRYLFSPRLRNEGHGEELGGLLSIFSYLVQEGDDLLRVAARCNVSISALASLNRISHREDLRAGSVLLLPTMPGIFVSERPETELERLIYAGRPDDSQGIVLTIPREGRTERFTFFPGDDFTPTERVFFLNRGFRFPLRDFRLTSLYGPRLNPVTGNHSLHRGIDLAAPEGTEVFAVRAGRVIDQGFDSILGNYIMIEHDNNWVSICGHLSFIGTAVGSRVQAGTVIGRVGSTGQSTGPHLHFELIQNGQNQDPARLLGIFTDQ